MLEANPRAWLVILVVLIVLVAYQMAPNWFYTPQQMDNTNDDLFWYVTTSSKLQYLLWFDTSRNNTGNGMFVINAHIKECSEPVFNIY